MWYDNCLALIQKSSQLFDECQETENNCVTIGTRSL